MRGPRSKLFAGSLAVLGTLLIAAPAAQGTVTIGSNLERTPSLGVACGAGGCTFALSSLDDPAFAAPGGVRSPTNGVVTGWRIRTGASSTLTALRVVRPFGLLFSGAGTSQSVTPPTGAISQTFATQLPIQKDDLIGIQCCAGGPFGTHFRIVDGNTEQWFAPGLGDNVPPSDPDDDEGELLLQADIEPTNTFTLDKVQSKKGSVTTVTVTVPNHGKLTAGDPSSPSVGAAAAKKKKKPKLFNNGAFRIGGPGQITMSIRASKTARKKIREKGGAIKAQLKIAFVPTGGSAGTQKVRVKLKP